MNMKAKVKYLTIGFLLTMGMVLSCTESANDDFTTTTLIKLTGIAMIAVVPGLAKKFNLFNN